MATSQDFFILSLLVMLIITPTIFIDVSAQSISLQSTSLPRAPSGGGGGGGIGGDSFTLAFDPNFHYPAIKRDGDPMPDLSSRSVNNILTVFYDPPDTVSEQTTFTIFVDGIIDQYSQYGINMDTDENGEGNFWILIYDPFSTDGQAFVVDENFAPVDQASFSFISPTIINISLPYSLWILGATITVVSFDRSVSEVSTPYGLLGEPIEMVGFSAAYNKFVFPEDLPDQYYLKSDTMYPQRTPYYVKRLQAMSCPPRNRAKSPDNAPGDDRPLSDQNRPDWLITDEVFGNFHIQVWCLDHGDDGRDQFDEFGEWVNHTDASNISGWIGLCPYKGGRNFVTNHDTDGNGIPDKIIRAIVDYGGDDDRDTKEDQMDYTYFINTKIHNALHYENHLPQPGESTSHPHPHPLYSNLSKSDFWI